MSQVSEFFTKWARKRGVTMAEELAKELRKQLGRTPFPPASRPGETPHFRTRRLLNSVKVVRTVTGARVEVKAPYASFLQYGTRFMDPRPFMTNALKKLGLKGKFRK